MKLPYEYSLHEIALMKSLNMIDIAESPSTPPPLMYMWMGLKCFRENRNDKISDSVRRCLLALDNCQAKDSPKRLTPEFDSLIEI